jgi:DNA-binding transcriptional LysR family regulator
MAVTMEWESRLGRRLRVRDLYILSNVVKSGSMAGAARQLSMSQPAVSEAVANLEHLLRVRLLERSTHGVAPTRYADAILKRCATVFDELQQGVRDVEFLADPTTGEVCIGYTESIAGTVLLSKLIERFTYQYPRVQLQADIVGASISSRFPGLRERKFDLVLARMWLPRDRMEDDLSMEFLFDDSVFVVAGLRTQWARRRKVDLAELVDEPWLLPPPMSASHDRLVEAFSAAGLKLPTGSLVTFSLDLRARLCARGRYVTVVPGSMLRHGGEGYPLKVLPIKLPSRPWPIMVVTLKNRILSPVAERFIACAHEIAKSMVGGKRGVAKRQHRPNVR